MNEQLFTDLSHVVIYHYADMLYKEKAKQAAKRLVKQGIITSLDDICAAYDQYEEMVIDYAKNHLPDDYDVTHDYWGAKCITNQKGWNAPKTNTLYAGDGQGQIMLFDGFQALKEYTETAVGYTNKLQEAMATFPS